MARVLTEGHINVFHSAFASQSEPGHISLFSLRLHPNASQGHSLFLSFFASQSKPVSQCANSHPTYRRPCAMLCVVTAEGPLVRNELSSPCSLPRLPEKKKETRRWQSTQHCHGRFVPSDQIGAPRVTLFLGCLFFNLFSFFVESNFHTVGFGGKTYQAYKKIKDETTGWDELELEVWSISLYPIANVDLTCVICSSCVMCPLFSPEFADW